MKIYADLHIHSRYARACSKDINLKNLEKFARQKGLGLLGTGDFTHPAWLEELKNGLQEDESGILKTETGFNFILQTEVSNIYRQGEKTRKIHNIILAKSFEVVEQINDFLRNYGKLASDGRPIFGSMNCPALVEGLKKLDSSIEIIPAHAWTPWFSIFGSKSGFDSVEECFQDQAKHIHALETGLSSDPPMNWRVSALDKYNLVSNSDAHSFWPWRIGRECNVFDIKLSYDNIIKAIHTGKGFIETLEVDPSYGKYHLDGHRDCKICLEPKESIKLKGICPKCKRGLTIGVLNRVEELADRAEGFKPEGKPDFKRIIPLSELISLAVGVKQIYSKKIFDVYEMLIGKFENEFNVLLETPQKELEKIADEKLSDLILRNREGKIEIKPGYDGVYGEPLIGKAKTKVAKGQKSLKEY